MESNGSLYDKPYVLSPLGRIHFNAARHDSSNQLYITVAASIEITRKAVRAKSSNSVDRTNGFEEDFSTSSSFGADASDVLSVEV